MRTTLTSLAALGFAVGMAGPALAQDAPMGGEGGDAQERLDAAGFQGARIIDGAEVARVTDDEGNTFFVVGGIGGGGMDHAAMGGAMGADAGQGMPPAGGAGEAPGAAADAGADIPEDGDLTAQVGEAQEPGGELDQAEAPAAEGGGMLTGDEDVAAEDLAPDTAETDTAEIGERGTVPDPNLQADLAEEPEGEGEPTTDLAGEAGDDAAEGEATEFADEPAADTGGAPGMAADAGAGQSLEDQLSEAGFSDYEIISGVEIAEVTIGEGDGQSFYVVLGLEDAIEGTAD